LPTILIKIKLTPMSTHTWLLFSSSVYFVSVLWNCDHLGFFGYTHTHTKTVIKTIRQSGVAGGYEVPSCTIQSLLPTEMYKTESS